MAKAQEVEFTSPFSLIRHDWKIDWKRITSNAKYDRPDENRTQKEERILEAIACVGVIGGLQLKNLFHVGNKQIKNMCQRHLLIKHTIWKNEREIPIYTIGKHGANRIMPEYRDNYWFEMDETTVLKCISFFQFCYLIDDLEIIPSPEPFTAGIMMNGNPFYVYVEREGIKDLLLFLKWKKDFKERIFIITEKLNYLRGMEIFMESEEPLKLRIILDEQLKKREFDLYYYDKKKSKWVNG